MMMMMVSMATVVMALTATFILALTCVQPN